MKPEEKLICDFAANFIAKNFDKIEYNLADSNFPKQKDKFIKEIKKDAQTAMWVITELAAWGMKERAYLKDIFVELPEDTDFWVLKIEDKYIKCEWKEYNYILSFTEPKEKTVIYFD